MLQKLETLKNRINALKNKKDNSCLMEAYDAKDYNLLFRRAATQSVTLDILEFLYLYKDDFNINVNEKDAKSNKSAIEVTIEHKSKTSLLFLLKTKEVEVDDTIRDKINKLDAKFRTEHIMPDYTQLGEGLIIYNRKLPNLTDEYSNSKNMRELVKRTQKEFWTIVEINAKKYERKEHAQPSQASELTDFKEINKQYEDALLVIHTAMNTCIDEINKISQAYDTFEKTFFKYLPYSYAQEKILYGNEYAKSNLNSTMLNTCLHNRRKLTETMETIQKNKNTLINHIEQLFIFFNIALTEAYSDPLSKMEAEGEIKQGAETILLQEASEQREKCLKAEPQPEVLTNDYHDFEGIREKSPSIPSEPDSSVVSKTLKNEIKPIDDKNFLYDKKKFLYTSPPIKSEIVLASKVLSPMLTQLQKISDELALLKKKGQVKLSVFLPILTSAANIIGLEIKRTKKGILIKQEEQIFSFHLPHQDKGVDKKAVTALQKMIDNEKCATEKKRPY